MGDVRGLGLMAAPLPEDFGGPATALDVSVVMEEFGKALVVEPIYNRGDRRGRSELCRQRRAEGRH
jgi:hypothetical protein